MFQATKVPNCVFMLWSLVLALFYKHLGIYGCKILLIFFLELKQWPTLMNEEALWIFES